jgi:hypothetical protein
VEWHKLDGRRFIDRTLRMEQAEGLMDAVRAALPAQAELKDAVVRLVLEYPFDLEGMIDEPGLRKYTEECLEFHFIRKPRRETRLRLPENQAISSLSSLELLDVYWNSVKTDAAETEALQKLASEVILASENPDAQA